MNLIKIAADGIVEERELEKEFSPFFSFSWFFWFMAVAEDIMKERDFFSFFLSREL